MEVVTKKLYVNEINKTPGEIKKLKTIYIKKLVALSYSFVLNFNQDDFFIKTINKKLVNNHP